LVLIYFARSSLETQAFPDRTARDKVFKKHTVDKFSASEEKKRPPKQKQSNSLKKATSGFE
jgi:hypothetical protein